MEPSHDSTATRGTEALRPRNDKDPEYVTIVRFDSLESLQRWEDSAECVARIEAARGFVVESTTTHAEGIEAWFCLPTINAPAGRPAR